MTNLPPEAEENTRHRFCTLAYSPSHGTEELAQSDQAVLLLLENPTDLFVLVAPDWKSRILPADLEFFEDIFADFAQRAKSDPLALLQQASELNFGPLVTQRTGYVDDHQIYIAELTQRFITI